mmetsp:Transcript_21096/g.49361  ORF Transcript_21096/g.49361 Transcript_21096/m.49361 type:complete len:445 (+) Transcript_21096:34-1368(+)|eukprot:CAMPEP_0114553744 /NCGR_PEP_ID=MMETSP0114-20121206/7834_1 /TAXON_ID=31324 /ORGANISM="Goniomonas sp, Strain m" /LENGTH=444 /DNA_ID=CAMNT_0001738733 /DNA_START=26 /DNA_END=1360 /DNA_ORIENTATION=-
MGPGRLHGGTHQHSAEHGASESYMVEHDLFASEQDPNRGGWSQQPMHGHFRGQHSMQPTHASGWLDQQRQSGMQSMSGLQSIQGTQSATSMHAPHHDVHPRFGQFGNPPAPSRAKRDDHYAPLQIAPQLWNSSTADRRHLRSKEWSSQLPRPLCAIDSDSEQVTPTSMAHSTFRWSELDDMDPRPLQFVANRGGSMEMYHSHHFNTTTTPIHVGSTSNSIGLRHPGSGPPDLAQSMLQAEVSTWMTQDVGPSLAQQPMMIRPWQERAVDPHMHEPEAPPLRSQMEPYPQRMMVAPSLPEHLQPQGLVGRFQGAPHWMSPLEGGRRGMPAVQTIALGVSVDFLTGKRHGTPPGRYSREQRQQLLHRFRQKRELRNFGRQLKYRCRKDLADSRVRIKGRFAPVAASGTPNSESMTQSATSVVDSIVSEPTPVAPVVATEYGVGLPD